MLLNMLEDIYLVRKKKDSILLVVVVHAARSLIFVVVHGFSLSRARGLSKDLRQDTIKAVSHM